MSTRPKDLALLRTLAIAFAGLSLPLVWPGMVPHLVGGMPGADDHGHETAGLASLLVAADLLTFGAYTVIAGLLALIVYLNRRSLPFDWVVLAFGLFIVACGFTHLMHVVTRLWPLAWLDGYVRAVTAIVSVATAAALPPLVPRVNGLLSAERRLEEGRLDLRRANVALSGAVERAELLAALGDALQGAVTERDVERAAVSGLAPAVHASAMLVVRVSGESVRSSTVWGDVPEKVEQALGRSEVPLGVSPVLEEVARSGRAVYVLDERREGRRSLASADLAYGLEPIVTGAGVVGCIVTWRARSRGPWTEEQRDLVRRGAGTIGLALERAQATAELERQRDALARANEQLARSNAELEQFAYVASHDLQAPIRAVTSFADVVERRHAAQLDERGRAYLRLVVENGMHMKRLVDDLLTFSRVTSAPSAPSVVDAAEVFDRVSARLEEEAAALGARVTRSALPRVVADESQLDSVLQNLVGNALKYHRSGVPPRVEVTAVRDGHWWRFAVSDNGIGIDARYFERIFEIFQRLHGRQEFEGTGIGLAVCKRIVERLGGRLWVESVPGEGSTFYFTVPGAQDMAAD